MNVIHYMFGLPPLRKGGLPKYALSLIEAQKKRGYNLKILVPGPFDKNGGTSVREWKKYKGIPCYRIFNGLPVANEYGIRETDAFTKPIPREIFEKWFEQCQVDMIHIHSILGLPVEFLEAARKRDIRIIMTTHDFFGLCPKIDLIRKGELCDGCDWSKCAECCQNAHNVNRLRFMHSDVYWWYCNQTWLFDKIHRGKLTKIKDFIKKLWNVNMKNIAAGKSDGLDGPADNRTEDAVNTMNDGYNLLKAYYRKIFACIDFFHFNSEQTEEVFRMHLGEVRGAVIDITNDDIRDDRIEKRCGDVLQLGYIGGKAAHKGFNFMAERLQQIYDEGRRKFVCHTFMLEDAAEYPFIVNHGPYQYGEQKEVFKLIDALVVPSQCRETYGMVVLEAICNGVPVLVSEYVGAKTLIKRFPGIGRMFSMQGDDFVTVIKDIYDNHSRLGEMNRQILQIPFEFDMEKHAEKIEELYTRV